MSAYQLTIAALLLGAVAQTSATWIAIERFLSASAQLRQRLGWAALAAANVLLTLQIGYALELALRTGLYDLRQALLGAVVALCLVTGVALKPRTA